MSLRQPDKDNQIDKWVRESLQRHEQEVDAAALVAKVRARMEQTAIAASLPKSTGSRVRRPSLTWRAVAAAAVLAGIICMLPLSTEPASAESIVQQALQEVVRRPQDRCYVIETDWNGSPEKAVLVQIPNQSLLWTHGDRFVLELSIPKKSSQTQDSELVVRCGRDDRGRIWFALTPQRGFRFDQKELRMLMELGEQITATGEFYSINSKALLGDFLENYDLQREPAVAGKKSNVVQAILAAPKSRQATPSIKKARLEFDSQSKLLRRVTLQRKSNSITFTLKEVSSAVKGNNFYQLETYLSAEGQRRLQSQDSLIPRIKGLIDSLKKVP